MLNRLIHIGIKFAENDITEYTLFIASFIKIPFNFGHWKDGRKKILILSETASSCRLNVN